MLCGKSPAPPPWLASSAQDPSWCSRASQNPPRLLKIFCHCFASAFLFYEFNYYE